MAEVQGHAEGNGTVAYRLERIERDVKELHDQQKERDDRIDRVVLAVVGFALTLAVFGLGIAVTLLTARH